MSRFFGDQPIAGAQGRLGDLHERRCRQALDDDVGELREPRQTLDRRRIAVAGCRRAHPLDIARRGGGEREARDAGIEPARHSAADRTEPGDRHLQRRGRHGRRFVLVCERGVHAVSPVQR